MQEKATISRFPQRPRDETDISLTAWAVVWYAGAMIELGHVSEIRLREFAMVCWLANTASGVPAREFLDKDDSSFISNEQEKELEEALEIANRFLDEKMISTTWYEECETYFLKKLNEKGQSF